MEDSKQGLININEANVEELCTLPGVGESLAERISAARPFEYLEDLEKVSGIGSNFVERLGPYVDLPLAPTDGAEREAIILAAETEQDVEESAPDDGVVVDEDEIEDGKPESIAEDMQETAPESDETISDSADEAIEAEVGDLTADEGEFETEEQVPPSPAPAGVSRSLLYGITFFGFIFALIIATAFSLGVIAALNNGNLVFASATQATVLAAEIDQLETSIQTLQSDLDSMRVRVDNLEALGDRVGALETSVESFQEELSTTTTLVVDLDQRVEGMESEMDDVKGSIERFQGFFEGLRELLTNVFTLEETNQ